MKIALFGYGVIGQAFHKEYIDYKFYIQDINKKLKITENQLKNADIAVICVNADFTKGGGLDTSNVCNCLTYLGNNDFKGLILIRTTLLPEQVEIIIKTYNDLNIGIWPEFLREYKVFNDFSKNEVLGGTPKQLIEFKKLVNKNVLLVNPKEAMELKIVRNLYASMKVSFWHSLYNSGLIENSRKFKENFDNLQELIRQGDCNKFLDDGKQGFGGKCLPKDLSAYLEVYENDLLNYMNSYNNKIRI